MTGQINLFEEIEAEERDRKSREAVRAGYRRWLTAEDLTPCGPEAYPDYGAYDSIVHLCDTMRKECIFGKTSSKASTAVSIGASKRRRRV